MDTRVKTMKPIKIQLPLERLESFMLEEHWIYQSHEAEATADPKATPIREPRDAFIRNSFFMGCLQGVV